MAGAGYDGLVDVGYDRHFRVHHGQDEFVQGAAHINGIESFGGFAKARPATVPRPAPRAVFAAFERM